MLAEMDLKAFVPTLSPDKAQFFYQELLGLELMSADEYALEFNAHGVSLRVITVSAFKPHEFTVLGWNVPDLSTLIHTMHSKGIFCERFPFLQQDNLGIWISPRGSKIAWFKDPDGNLLSLTEL